MVNVDQGRLCAGPERTGSRGKKRLRSAPGELRNLPKPYSGRRLECLNEKRLPSSRILHSFLKILESSSICLSMAAEWAAAP